MLTKKVIDVAETELAAPLVSTAKKDVLVCFRVGYRKRNAVTGEELYPLPCMDYCIHFLKEAIVFSTLHE